MKIENIIGNVLPKYDKKSIIPDNSVVAASNGCNKRMSSLIASISKSVRVGRWLYSLQMETHLIPS